MTPNLTTRDLGLAIRDHLEDNEVFQIVPGGGHGESDTVEFVDCSDCNNIKVQMLNGQSFIVRIIAA